MVCSMTGFGRSEITEGNRKYIVELKSVNNRYLDINIKMPKKFNAFEAAIRSELKNYMKRGKVDVFISYEDFSESETKVKYNKAIAQEYYSYLNEMAGDFGLDNDVRISVLSRFPEVFTMEEEELNEEEVLSGLMKALAGAGKQFMESRAREGEFLCKDLTEKLDGMMENVEYIAERSPEIIKEYKDKLREKIQDLLEDKQVDENRLAMEVTIYADKICVDEEITRLRSHIGATKDTLLKGDDKDGIGRKLDFLAQEMNREANTILSKSTDLKISDRGIALKTDIEKVREQIQNIE
ncbi:MULTISPECIES: YicC/YloC family endoribonuclease [unclassified Butyrivibrio]|uniref:YicC/YloC family endoribonuclease n=1 Tax=unclassified Butyrivibrio TaxID=2639466 RepID=UPI0003B73125|nr:MULTISPECIES: YicC/YloC family endoribonuclease [unclassified Butyrivibrio]MBE5837334.1 YicC family protein [Butyrivibrio sp.]MBP3817947.1 YicC family protein [Butyrivibrio sp.]MBQ6415137.1 YicC family protein [Butyrivibrio sp.]MBQ9305892.1 YicC family protein [Butyrivibrio sp.]SEG26308.1 TIGR00255 family protein [Butyrivibrio sp. Su6]